MLICLMICQSKSPVPSQLPLPLWHLPLPYNNGHKLEGECYDRASWTIIFFPSIPFPFLPYHCTTDTLPSLLVIALSWIHSLLPRLGQDALRTVRFLPYLLHALPSPLLYYLRVHQYLLMCTLHAPPMPAPPHCSHMYHCTICARYQTP